MSIRVYSRHTTQPLYTLVILFLLLLQCYHIESYTARPNIQPFDHRIHNVKRHHRPTIHLKRQFELYDITKQCQNGTVGTTDPIIESPVCQINITRPSDALDQDYGIELKFGDGYGICEIAFENLPSEAQIQYLALNNIIITLPGSFYERDSDDNKISSIIYTVNPDTLSPDTQYWDTATLVEQSDKTANASFYITGGDTLEPYFELDITCFIIDQQKGFDTLSCSTLVILTKAPEFRTYDLQLQFESDIFSFDQIDFIPDDLDVEYVDDRKFNVIFSSELMQNWPTNTVNFSFVQPTTTTSIQNISLTELNSGVNVEVETFIVPACQVTLRSHRNLGEPSSNDTIQLGVDILDIIVPDVENGNNTDDNDIMFSVLFLWDYTNNMSPVEIVTDHGDRYSSRLNYTLVDMECDSVNLLRKGGVINLKQCTIYDYPESNPSIYLYFKFDNQTISGDYYDQSITFSVYDMDRCPIEDYWYSLSLFRVINTIDDAS